jgi:hypothetical protein
MEPPALRGLGRRVGADMAGLIQAMTSIAVDARPPLAVVRQRLLGLRDGPRPAREQLPACVPAVRPLA